MVSLQLARSSREANGIKREWQGACLPQAGPEEEQIDQQWALLCQAGSVADVRRIVHAWTRPPFCLLRSAAEAKRIVEGWKPLAHGVAKAWQRGHRCRLRCVACSPATPDPGANDCGGPCSACMNVDAPARSGQLKSVTGARHIASQWRSLCGAQTPSAATRTNEEWTALRASTGCDLGSDEGRLGFARCNLRRDDRFVLVYTASLVFLAFLFLRAVSAPLSLAVGVALVAVAAGLCDWAENRLLAQFLGFEGRPAWLERLGAHGVTLTRTVSQTKWGLLLLAGLAVLTAGAAALRRWWHQLEPDSKVRKCFKDLAETEGAHIFSESGRTGYPDVLRVAKGPSAEPWVSFRSRDIIGLALSGGGIRSATFNLGLLTGLNKLNILGKIDYLATVSGGGYLGSFWTAWLAHQKGRRILWPDGNGLETGPVRHLREFSRFLATRRGFFEAEMWEAIVAVVAGLIPAFAAAASVIGLALVFWLGTNFFLACPEPWAGMAAVLVLTGYVLRRFELEWAAGDPVDPADADVSRRVNIGVALVALGLSLWFAWWLIHRLPQVTWWSLDGASGWSPPLARSYETWWRLTGIERTENARAWFWSPRLYDLALVWLLAGGVLLAMRAPFAVIARRGERDRVWGPAFDRVVMRLLGSAVAWAAVATLWHVSVNFLPLAKRMTVASLFSAGLFAALRNWIGVALRSGTQAGTLDRLKPYIPQALAYLTVALLVAGVGSVEISLGGSDWMAWFGLAAAMAFAIGVMTLLDPGEIGLHSFYRDRIVRAYSGASNPDSGGDPEDNRQTDRRAKDDLHLEDLPVWPLHLVCCAANDLHADPIGTLGRGARSAVLSRHGIALADGWEPPPTWVTLGGAVTASAAAFNSNMGGVSMSVGPVVSFLMATLNLRLGLWVPNPRGPARTRMRVLPGVLFFREMFALTLADDQEPEIHLSDGGHFENLALYELVRRHCRYIVVSDCGEDPNVAFEDFGNAARRIREDFGVDIDVDLGALRPSPERRSRQHAVVGTIHYSPFDKGILIYVKPTLTGDEPPDILQYATANHQFPHEPTSDQFYDEAQWESYRALGEHTACTVFGFVDRHRGGPPSADWIFTTARQEWYPTPPDLPARVLKMTERFGAIESEIRSEGAATMLVEVFPELQILAGSPASPRATVADDQGHAANLACLLRVSQLMEDVWTYCELDAFWNHPLNLGWVNCFARWASAPTFRMWWPLIRPMYGVEFQRFMQERFPVLDRQEAHPGTVAGPTPAIPDGLSKEWWEQRHAPAPVMVDAVGQAKKAYEYRLELPGPDDASAIPMQLGLVLVRQMTDGEGGDWLWWTSDDFFVPPSLWGAGIGGTFLAQLLKRIQAEQKIHRLEVFVKAPQRQNDAGSWADRVGFVEFYKAHGFCIASPEVDRLPDGQVDRAVKLALKL